MANTQETQAVCPVATSGTPFVVSRGNSEDTYMASRSLSWPRGLLLTGTLGSITLGFDLPTPPNPVTMRPSDLPGCKIYRDQLPVTGSLGTPSSYRFSKVPRRSPFADKLEELGRLADNWNGYGSQAPNEQARSWASYALDRLCEHQLIPLDVVPSPDGGVVIVLQDKRRRYADIEILNAQIVLAGLDASDMPAPRALEANDMGDEFTDIVREIRDHFA